MGSISPWHWLIVLLAVGVPLGLVYVTYRTGKKKGSYSATGGPVGFGGWLILIVIGQTLAPLRTLSNLNKNLDDYESVKLVSGGPLAVYGEVAITLAFFVLQVVVAVSMYNRSRKFPRLFFFQWIALPLTFVLDILLIVTIFHLPVSQAVSPQEVGQTLGAFAVTGLWVWYLHASTRVRNTFVK